jgi:penicillin G amidase
MKKAVKASKSRVFLSIFIIITVLIILVLAVSFFWIRSQLVGSLAILDGELKVDQISAPVQIERDDKGVPKIQGASQKDVSFALGFLHAQERFFQMDLIRRRAAGELAEIFGSQLLQTDRSNRLHLFRQRAKENVERLSPEDKEIISMYVDGVNAGLHALKSKPFEYLALRLDPQPWKMEDCFLAIYAMYFDLNDASGAYEAMLATLYDTLPKDMADFLAPIGCEWDAPVAGSAFQTPAIPGSDIFSITKQRTSVTSHNSIECAQAFSEIGSNNWAVSGAKTADGRALLANDMHLGISVPNTWYRAMLVWGDEEKYGEKSRIAGVTLPGAPAVVAGTNFHVSWGFTNSFGDWVDLVKIELNPDNNNEYQTPMGYEVFEKIHSSIKVKDAKDDTLVITSTIWGPIIDKDFHGAMRAVRWIAHDVDGVNLNLINMVNAKTVEQAQAIANVCSIPPQNFVCADKDGRIGWTIIGKIPKRIGFSGRTPVSWADGRHRWEGRLQAKDYPRIIDPSSGIIWTANARVVGGQMFEIVGDGRYDLGARAKQIRDGLLNVENATEGDMLAIQLDDRAIFLQRWRDMILQKLSPDAVSNDSLRQHFRSLIDSTWTGRASINSVAYRLVRAYRLHAFQTVFAWLTAECNRYDARFNIWELNQWEGPLWKLITEQPTHLLSPEFKSWDEALLAIADSTISTFHKSELNLHESTWGSRNTSAIKHPLAYAVPQVATWLNMPATRLPGDSNMPRFQSRSAGASERFAVSPSHEADAYFHMPGGQSGHFLSPYYRGDHQAWEQGLATPFLPAEIKWTLRLEPKL